MQIQWIHWSGHSEKLYFKCAVSFKAQYHAVVSMTKSLASAHMAGAQKAKGPPGEPRLLSTTANQGGGEEVG